jgi:PAS domain S-box-containing protein
MNDTSAVPVVVHSVSRDPVEALNSLLRRSGLAVHCTWIPAVADLPDALEQLNPELLLCAPSAPEELKQVAGVRDHVAAIVPLIVVREQVDERVIAEDMANGARDTVSLRQSARLAAVIQRELRAFRLERTLTNTLRASQDYRSQLEHVLQRSNDAIAQVQEGILVDVNTAWTELFGYQNAAGLIGQPAMDFFDPDTHAPLKGALTACVQGRWSDHVLKAGAMLADGSVASLELVLALGEFEGDASVRLIVPAQKHDERQMQSRLEQAVHSDPGTGLWTRIHLLKLLSERLTTPVRGGVRFLACVRPDKFASIERDLGVIESEEFLAGFAGVVRAQLGPHDIAGHLGGTLFLVLLERGNAKDVEAWSENLIDRVGKHLFQVGDRTLHATCSIGLGVVPLAKPDLNASINDALDALRRARERSGNQFITIDRADNDTRVQAYDQIWVKHIRSALMENRFRLVQQPVAALGGGEQTIFDVAIRMMDQQGKEVLPSEFLPAAARNDLMKNIDRWVLGASLSFAAKSKPDLLFVRLSKDSTLDRSLLPWLDMQLKASRAEPQRLCIQLTEDIASNYLQPTQELTTALRQRGLRVALEHFGSGRGSLPLLQALTLDFLKIDGALMQGLTGNEELQQRVRTLVEAATRRNVQTVAERIEDANTMAVVWQLGVQYIQGYFVHAPEEVVLKS